MTENQTRADFYPGDIVQRGADKFTVRQRLGSDRLVCEWRTGKLGAIEILAVTDVSLVSRSAQSKTVSETVPETVPETVTFDGENVEPDADADADAPSTSVDVSREVTE